MNRSWYPRSLTIVVAAMVVIGGSSPLSAEDDAAGTLRTAQALFYNGSYAAAATLADALCTTDAESLPACELHTSSLLFQLRRGMGEGPDREKAFAACQACPALLARFLTETREAQAVARARLKAHPDEENTLFFLGKVDLNYVWLQLGILGKKTGWDEYWEARRSLDQVLKASPANIRAKVARAWIDYIVDTRMPRGTRWVLGGGSKKRGLQAVREAAVAASDEFVRAEATFALWDMQVRERDFPGAVQTARGLAIAFPDNVELRKFVATQTN
jgi:hypothetical protein